MTLDQLIKFENIQDYYILWYGADITDDYMNDTGIIKGAVEMSKGKPKDSNDIYIFLSGIDKKLVDTDSQVGLLRQGMVRNIDLKE